MTIDDDDLPARIEFLIAWADGTWTTIIEIASPDDTIEGHIGALMQQTRFRNVALITVYSESPD